MSSAAAIKISSTDSLHEKRFAGILRPYAKADVERLRGSVKVEHTLATLGARRL
jgi:isocitrate lyase